MQPNDPNLKQQKQWVQHIKRALSSHLLFKCIGITVFISLFFVAYFHVLNHPAYPATVIPLTYVDTLIELQPWTLPLYLSLWVYITITPMLTVDKHELYAFTVSIGFMSIVGLALFYWWPTTTPPTNIDWSLYPSMHFLKGIDAAGNACPSMHVATAFFSGAWADYLFRRTKAPSWFRVINLLWGVGIIYATIATRQHVALDVLGGLVLASIALLISKLAFWQE